MVNFRSNFLHVPQHKSMRFFSFPHQENMGKVSERIRFDGTQLLGCSWHRDSRLKIISSEMVNFRSNFSPCSPTKIYLFFSFPHQGNMGKVSKRIKFNGTQLLGCPWHGDGRLKKISSKMVNFRSNFPHVPQHKSMCFFSFPHHTKKIWENCQKE